MKQNHHWITFPTLLVLKELLRSGDEGRYGMQLARQAQLTSGTTYPILHRLLQYGILRVIEETGDPKQLGRPLRTQYFLTAAGKKITEDVLAQLQVPELSESPSRRKAR